MEAARHRFVELNGNPFHYLEWGSTDAPVLLFLHGFPEYGAAWTEVAESWLIPTIASRLTSAGLAKAGPRPMSRPMACGNLSGTWRP